MNTSPLFFISYARHEQPFMDAIIKSTLESNGLVYWHDMHLDSTVEDDKWWKEICKQIEIAPYFTFLFTEKWQNSEICRKELATAESMGKTLIPVQMNEFSIEKDLLYLKSINITLFHELNGQSNLNNRYCNAREQFEKKHSKSERQNPKEQLSDFCTKVAKNNENIRVLGKGKPRKLLDIYLEIKLKPINQGASSSVSASEILLDRLGNQILLIGGPGSGKSTVLQYLQIAAASDQCEYFPVKISFRSLAYRDKNFVEWLNEHVKGQTGVNVDYFKSRKNKLPPRLMVLLDGLDEINDTDYQRLSKEIINFSDASPNVKFVITSRPTGYHEKDFLDFDFYELLPLREKDIRNYIEKVVPKDGVEKIWNIITSHPRIYELAETPFLLAMISAAHSELGHRAKQRASLYRKCISFLLRVNDWEPKREKTSSNEADRFFRVLKNIALRFYKLESDGSFSKTELLQIISLIPGCQNEAESILNIIVERTGLLQIDSEGYHFIHRSIWEFLAAEGCRDEPIDQLVERANSRLWEEPIRLYVGLTPEADLSKTLEVLWSRNTTLTLRCMTETYSFPSEILEDLYKQTSHSEKKRVVYDLRAAAGRANSAREKNRILLDTISVLTKIESNCEILYNLILMLKDSTTQESVDLISNILKCSTIEERFQGYLNDPDFKLEFIYIEGQEFQMGLDILPDGTPSDASEKPKHPVKIDGFYITKYLITNKLFYDSFPFSFDRRNEYSMEDMQPVNMVNWYEAIIFSWWLGCDLPTDAEWEYVARSGGDDDVKLYDPDTLPNYAWYGENSNNRTHQVGKKLPNSLGVYDVAGNLREWVKDWYSEDYYTECKSNGMVNNPVGPKGGDHKVLRGGTFDWALTNLRPTYRNGNTPDNRNRVTGFRLVYRESNRIINQILGK